MKELLVISIFLFLSLLSLSQDSDSSSIDTSYRLSNFQNTFYRLYGFNSKFVKASDTNIRLIVTQPERPKRIRRVPAGGNHPIGSNYGSTQNVDPKIGAIISVCFLLFVLYIIYRVRKSFKNDKTKGDLEP